MSQSQLAAYLASGKVITYCPPRSAHYRLVWLCASHETHMIPISLGIVGRW